MKKLLIAAAALLMLSGCTSRQDKYVDWLYRYMPLPDSLTYGRQYWEDNVEKTLEVRDMMGWNVPEREFRHFVLPLRVNNETLDDFRTTYADTLCRRVKGMSIGDAALEINHWCHEQATYRGSDARTSSPLETCRRGTGRCGEESVLTVAALRAAGIPARQVYTPRWAHTDDNHAWVEVWADGKWWFMGACEPEARLNMGWFNAPVSRAMLLHTKVFGDYRGKEDVITRTPCYTEINVISGYVSARPNRITVVDTLGKAVSGADVEFKIYNYGEFYTVARYVTDEKGHSSLNTGKGDLLVWAHKDGKFGFAVASSEETTVVLEHNVGDSFGVDIDIVPPVENPIVTDATAEDIAANSLRLKQEDSIRATHDHVNHAVEAFSRRREAGVSELLACLTAKDLGDVSMEVLEDALAGAAGLDPHVLDPRVELEALLPCREEIISSGIADRLHGPEDVVSWVRDSIRIVDGRNPQGLRIPPRSVWRSRMSDRKSRGIFFVALSRTLGIPARIDPVTGKTQYMQDCKWMDVDFDGEAAPVESAKGTVKFTCSSDPCYYRHFTIAKLLGGRARLLEYGEDSDDTPLSTIDGTLDEGNYVVTSGTRLSDGSVLAHMEFFTVEAGKTVEAPLVMRTSDSGFSVIGSMDPEQKFLQDGCSGEQSILSATGRGVFLIAIMGDKDEPTQHAVNSFESEKDVLNAWGRPILFLGERRPAGLENAIYGKDPDGKVKAMLTESAALPVIAACDSFGHIFYLSQGYATSLGESLRSVSQKLAK